MKMLMQRLSLQALTRCASFPLPPRRDVQPPLPPTDPFDIVGKAVDRGALFNPQAQRQPPTPPPTDPVDEFTTENVGTDVTVQSVSPAPVSGGRGRDSRKSGTNKEGQETSPEHRLVTTGFRHNNL